MGQNVLAQVRDNRATLKSPRDICLQALNTPAQHPAQKEPLMHRLLAAEVITECNGPSRGRCVVVLTLRMLLIGMSVKVPVGAAGAGANAGAAGAAGAACRRRDLICITDHRNRGTGN